MDFLQNIGPFLLAVVAVIINGVPAFSLPPKRGASPSSLQVTAYLVGAFGNLLRPAR